MAHLKFYSYNWAVQDATDITIDVGDVNPFFPLANIKHDFSTKVYRSQDATLTSKIIFDLKGTVPIDTCIIKGHAIDGLGATSMLIEASGSTDFTTPLLSETLTIKNDYNLAYKLFTETSARYWRITLTNTGDYVELGNIFLGVGTTLDYNNIGFGWTIQNADLTKETSNRYKQKFFDLLNSFKEIKASYKYLTETELLTLNAIFEYHGKSIPVWLFIDNSGDIIGVDDIAFFGGQFRFKNKPEIVNVAYKLYDLEIELEEAV